MKGHRCRKHSGRRWQITALAVGLLSAYKSIVHLLKYSQRSFGAKLFKKPLSVGKTDLLPRKMQKANAQIYEYQHLGNTESPTIVFLHKFCLFDHSADFNEWRKMREWRVACCSTVEQPKNDSKREEVKKKKVQTTRQEMFKSLFIGCFYPDLKTWGPKHVGSFKMLDFSVTEPIQERLL